ncbi:MAG: YciI family protein [Verrucomicrobiota bacterium]
MEYLLLIYGDEKVVPQDESKSNTERYATILEEYMAFSKEVEEAGIVLGANPLESVANATTVRVRDGKTQTTDGPFAETKEQLAGYYLLDCETEEEALKWAAKIPGAKWGSIEVRPIMKFE